MATGGGDRLLGELASWPRPYERGHLGAGGRGALREAVAAAARASPGGRLGYEDFVVVGELGRGSLGKVQRVELKGTGLQFAMKTVELQGAAPSPLDTTGPGQLSPVRVRRVLRELEVLTRLGDHPSVAVLFDTFGDDARRHSLVLELCVGGDLASVAGDAHRGRLPEGDVRAYGAAVVGALGALHTAGCLYRDLKPENILLRGEGEGGGVALADFDLSDPGGGAGDEGEIMLGTLDYLPAEVVKAGTSAAHTRASDLWQCGVLMHELLFGRAPFASPSQERTMYNITMRAPEFPLNDKSTSYEAKQCIRALLRQDPKVRLGGEGGDAAAVLQHDFFVRGGGGD